MQMKNIENIQAITLTPNMRQRTTKKIPSQEQNVLGGVPLLLSATSSITSIENASF